MKQHHEKKLGRGLSALIGDGKSKNSAGQKYIVGSAPKLGVEVEEISVTKITAGIYQPRRSFDENSIKELSDSIRENGLIQPIILRKSDDEGHYEIIAGERRFRAIKILGKTKIAAIVKKINNHEALEIALIENVQRSDLSLIEEAKGYEQLMEEFSYTQEQVAKKTGKSRSHVANIMRLLDLPESVKSMIDEKKISMGHARAIIKSKNPEELANKIVEDSLNVRETEEIIRDEKVEELRKDPVVARKESTVKFVNSGELTDLENSLSDLLDSKVKISFNQFKNSGKLTVSFDDLEKIYNLKLKLES